MIDFLRAICLITTISYLGIWFYRSTKKQDTKKAFRNALIALGVFFVLGLFGGADSPTKDNTSHDNQRASLNQSKKKPVDDALPRHQKRATTRTTAHQQANHKKLLTKLISYTNRQSAGPTYNYYWISGKAKFNGFKGMKRGSYRFTQDKQGRPSVARAVLTYGEYAASRGSRQGNPLDPYGWPTDNPKVAISYSLTGRTYHGYLYNRSHSIADSLLGEKSYRSENNFTTGTRPQNVGADQNGGMRYAEEIAESFWEENPNTTKTIAYQTTPLYHSDESIPRGSVIDIKSSDGSINTEIVVINSVEGIKVNYDTGNHNAKSVATHTRPSHRGSSASHSTATQTRHGSPTHSGKWTVAATGMVYVSDSGKYYSRVTNPGNYSYVSEQQAISSGAVRAPQGNQYAQP